MRWPIIPLAMSTIFLAGSSLSVNADGQQTPEQIWNLKHSDAVVAEFVRRESRLKTEIDSGGGPEWAATYYRGDGLGVNVHLVIAPQGGFVFSWSGCMGVYDRNYGAIDAQRDRVTLAFELPNGRHDSAAMAQDFVPVHWGERLYLLSAGELDEFVNAINAGQEPCAEFCAGFLLRAGDESKPVAGRPHLPPKYAARLLAKPIDAKVVTIFESYTTTEKGTDLTWRTTRVAIDAGSEHGVWQGMAFHSMSHHFMAGTFIVQKVNARSSIAIAHELDPDDLPATGICLSTRLEGNSCPDEQSTALR